ncbi:MAG: nucleotidyltransferase family protein [Caldisericota bacterium]|nr:nucleotidyltransferase family protein [Caldisericota bacterium]
MTTAVILAAGHADRMGANKLVLPIGTSSVVGRVVDVALDTCDKAVVVIGLHDTVTRTAVERAVREHGAGDRVQIVQGVPYDPGMFISVQAGLRSAGDSDVVLIFPGDIPLGCRETAIAVRDAVLQGPGGIAVPVHDDRHGHPIGISSRYLTELEQMSPHATLRQFLQAHWGDVALVPVDDVGMLMDMDTPADYDAVLDRAAATLPYNQEV